MVYKKYAGPWESLGQGDKGYADFYPLVGMIARLRSELRIHAIHLYQLMIQRGCTGVAHAVTLTHESLKLDALRINTRGARVGAKLYAQWLELHARVGSADKDATLIIEGVWAKAKAPDKKNGNLILADSLPLARNLLAQAEVDKSSACGQGMRLRLGSGVGLVAEVQALELGLRDLVDMIASQEALRKDCIEFFNALHRADAFVSKLSATLSPKPKKR